MTEDTLEGGAGPFKAKLTGQNSIYIAILALALSVIVYVLWNDIRENRVVSHEEHTTIQQGIDEMVYVQSLSDEERRKLNLTMPESLAKKRKSAWVQP